MGIHVASEDLAESLRSNKCDLLDLKDRSACLTKPAGAEGSSGSTVAQSGVSKRLDAAAGHKLLGSIAKSLSCSERIIAEYALLVLRGRPVTSEEARADQSRLPRAFELFNAAELIDGLTKLQLSFKNAGEQPEVERSVTSR